MNGFIRKYRWMIVIVGGGLATGLAYYSQQDGTPDAVVLEQPEIAVVSVEADEVQAPADVVALEEPATEVLEPETSTSEPDAVDETVVVEEPSEVDVTTDDPVVESIEETATADMTSSQSTSEPETTSDALVEDTAGALTGEQNGDAASEAVKPTFDIVRVDTTGSAVIAGTAEPYSKVIILSNGEDIGEAIAGASGEFVAIIQVPENEQGQTLELESEIDGQLLFSDETILILPIMRSDAANAVTEESAPPIIRATAEEIVIIQGGAQLALGQISLDSISYDENDEVVLAGRGNPGRTIIIYVDDAPLMDAVVSDSGSWKQALHGLDAGRYVLRVDEIDVDGNVTSRVESPFQREYPEDVREAKATNATTYTVQPGNSLWIIATGRYGDGLRYHQIFSANQDQIRDPNLIYPGQVFAIPDAQE